MPVLTLRADRFVTLGLVQPLLRLGSHKAHLRVPILMYHSIADVSSAATHPYFVTGTAPKTFRAHMAYLKDNGYAALSPEQLIRLMASDRMDQKKAVVLTFDDGYRDFYRNAFPILHEFGFSATMYLPTKFIGITPRTFLGKECLTWPEVRELHKAGIAFGSHTVTHSKLRFMATSSVECELRESKDTIESELGVAIGSFAYPFAFPEEDSVFTDRLKTVLENCGYTNGVSTIIGSKHLECDKFFLKRLPANSLDDLKLFNAKLEGSYDWMYWPQSLSKRLKFKMKR